MSSRILHSIAVSLALAGAVASAQEHNGKLSEPRARAVQPATQRLLVKWRDGGGTSQQKSLERVARAHKLGADTGLRLKLGQEIAPALDVVELESALTGAELTSTLALVRANASVEFAEPDRRRHPHRIPSDALFVNQWYQQSTQISAVRTQDAWDTTIGSSGTVVAVLDTGVRYSHTDLGRATQAPGKLLPGFDFIANAQTANDGNGRDADPSDPGDWIDTADRQQPAFSNCELTNSSWHGTRVSGIIGALSDNGAGMAGMGWTTWVLPVRVLGKCGGDDSDILSAMRWAAGLAVAGAPTNPYPAKVINLSLGADGPCGLSYVNVVNELANAGVVVVASAGNDGGSVDAPANCPGVVSVGAIRHIGTKVGFSNVGPGVTISAPGGNCVNTGPPCLFSIDTATDTGTTSPVGPAFTDQFNFNVGTSFSSPIVAGAVALMHSVNARLPTSSLTARLRESARPFPTTSNSPASAACPLPVPVCHVPVDDFDIQICECICTTQTCGAGMLDAAGAVAAALRPAVSIQLPATVTAGQNVALNASASAAACNRTLSTFAWTGPVTITGADQSTATVQAPVSGEFTVRLTITDNQGATDFADVTVRTNSASTTATPLLAGNACPTAISVPQDPPTPPPPPPPPPPSGGGGGGGGGALGLEVLAMLLGILRATRRTHARRDTRPVAGLLLD